MDQSYSLDHYIIESGRIRRIVNFKEHHKFQYISPMSNHSKLVFKNLIKNEGIRYSTISSTESDYRNAVKLFTIRLKKLGLRNKFIRKHLINYGDVCQKTLKYKYSRSFSKRKLERSLLLQLIFDKHYRLDRTFKRLFERVSVRSKANVKILLVNILQSKVRGLLSTRKILHSKVR